MAAPPPPNPPPVPLPQQPQDGNVLRPAQAIYPPTANDVLGAIKYRKNVELSIGMYIMHIILSNILIRFQPSVPPVTDVRYMIGTMLLYMSTMSSVKQQH